MDSQRPEPSLSEMTILCRPHGCAKEVKTRAMQSGIEAKAKMSKLWSSSVM